MRYLVFIALLSISAVSLQAQENRKNRLKSADEDKAKYEKDVFNKELGEKSEKQDPQRLYDLIPENLPAWFFDPIMVNPIRIIGISDPGMKREDAYSQALLRAKAIYALINHSTISNIADDYTSLHESSNQSTYQTKFQDFTLSKSRIAYSQNNIVILDTFYTKYNEGIVKIEIKNANTENFDTLEVKGEHLQIFTERGSRKEKIEFFNLSVNDYKQMNDSIENAFQYNFRKVNRDFDIASIYGSRMIDFPERSFNYQSDIDFVKDSTDNDIQSNTLTLGLWNAYLCGILNNVTQLSKQLASRVKNSNDFYTLKNEGLIRTVARSKARFEINKFKLLQNQIYIDLYGETRR
ncbi:MAG: hypothetical protein A2W99_10740 [Bacteroidetes bacterium GWF2_33_16]|nr:MAG: hypothetical protein A2X00_05000 [Bacteroidetes bacterium GWE2_32_14]OFY04015.1 MAG: hypothetical protein A2W99_10740 [Bacteroidetes bacterium GWF2_33_16]